MPAPLKHKTSSTKNNSSSHKVTASRNSTEPKPDPTLEELVDMIKKLSLGSEDNKHRKKHHRVFRNIPPTPSTPRRLDDDVSKNNGADKKNKVKYSTDTSSNSNTSDSNSDNSSGSSSEIEVVYMKRPILKRRVKGKVSRSEDAIASKYRAL
jgi:hypothetical protein